MFVTVGCSIAADFTIQEGVNVSGGVAYIPRNRNRNSEKVSEVTTPVINCTYGGVPTITLEDIALGSNKTGGGSSDGGRNNSEWVLKPNTKYLFRLLGANVIDNGVASIVLDWYEHADKV